ncbi:MAG: SAM-dependent methyltransferase [Actinomycetia bacterium]|nr:SAM-dependent methyltransferase [Actinomycetes bacterium]
MAAALYGAGGFYRTSAPKAHFRTSISASTLLAASIVQLVVAVDQALGSPSRLDIVDVGASDGSLLVELVKLLPSNLAPRVNPVAVEIRPRPRELLAEVNWTEVPPSAVNGLVIAHEYLDNVPCDVVEVTEGSYLEQVLVDPATGDESLGPELTGEQAAWVKRWWPLTEPGDRAEVGSTRDKAWAQLVGSLNRGLAVAVDYGHMQDERIAGAYPAGSLTGYRGGRQVTPIPDGSCDITAHVAMDACQHAGAEAGATSSALVRQAAALHALGLDARRPPIDLAHSDPPAYVDGLLRASHAAELLDPTSLGSFWWLLQAKGCRPEIDGIDWS